MTKKEMQRFENMLCEQAWKKAKPIYFSDSLKATEIQRINQCQAWSFECGGYVFFN